MFTGIIEQVGTISAVEPLGDSVRLTIDAPAILDGVALGDSIAVNGVCLTVAEHTATTFTADCMQETLDRSNLGELRVGSPVNLERAALVNARLDGHIVQGHVDATTTLTSRKSSEHWDVLRFALPPTLARYIVEKGSIAINGTSLTVSALGDDYFEVSLIPITLRDTIFGKLAVGGTVNLEVDVLAKYVERNLTFRT
ncbi:riboflavin synthase [Corynebacterium durum]|uniref:Riboflavin synthase n=1 Tax=Corynebacterium durum F0235 TaxID=1035195 RepID=L1MHN8_9CORY|nr:riboflavin synthase [Corynebacterium durum]EKX90575.1 riboflavin synthase, alpha subunit [Corynebacterium durum F0235]